MQYTAIGTVAAVVGVLIVIASIVGGQWRISRFHTVLEAAQAWQIKSEAQDAEISDLRTEVAKRDDQIADLQIQLTEVRGHLKFLQEMVIGGAALDTLRGDIHDARDQILSAIGERPAA